MEICSILKNSLAKKVSVATSVSLLVGFLGQSVSADEKTVKQQSLIEDVSIDENLNSLDISGLIKDSDLKEESLKQNFDLATEVQNMPSVQQMTEEQKEMFNKIVDEQVALSGLEGEAKYAFHDTIEGFFDKSSEIYNDIEKASSTLEEKIDDLDDTEENKEIAQNILFGTNSIVAASEGIISVRVAGATLNTAIGFAVGGGVGAIQAFIVSKGKKEAQKLFTKTVVSRLNAWGAPKLAASAGAAVAFALNYSDIGTNVAKWYDKRDSKPNNGYVNLL